MILVVKIQHVRTRTSLHAVMAHAGPHQSTGSVAPTNTTATTRPRPRPSREIDHSRFPPVYLQVYERCRVQGGGQGGRGGRGGGGAPLCEHGAAVPPPLLSSSGLPRPLLRRLWDHANRASPGQLTQGELFVLLGLIGLAQVRMLTGEGCSG